MDVDPSADVAAACADDLFFAVAVPIPGIMHILHNAAKDVTDNMYNFNAFWVPLNVFCNFMKKKPNRDRVIGQCFSTPPASWHAERVAMFVPDLTDTRWGYLIATLEDLMSIETPLRTYWVACRVNIPAQKGAGDGGDDGDPSEFVGAAEFWAYGKMLLIANSLIVEIQSWIWGCNCHRAEHMGTAVGASWQTRSRVFRKVSPSSPYGTCPMRGRRAPELAAGFVDTFLDKHKAIAIDEIVMLTANLSVEARARLLRDFHSAHTHLAYIVTLKLSVFNFNPHKLLGIGHPDFEVARQCCRQSFDLVSADGGNGGVQHHPWVIRNSVGWVSFSKHNILLTTATFVIIITLSYCLGHRARPSGRSEMIGLSRPKVHGRRPHSYAFRASRNQ
jgi:hypothetical protein